MSAGRSDRAPEATSVHTRLTPEGHTDDYRAVTIIETIDTDPVPGRRREVDMTIGAQSYHFERASHVIDITQVIPILKQCGSRSMVALPEAKTRDHYDSLLGMNLQATPRPANDLVYGFYNGSIGAS